MLPYFLDDNPGTESSMGTIQSTMDTHVCTCCKQCLAEKMGAQKLQVHGPQSVKEEFKDIHPSHSPLFHAAHAPHDPPKTDAMHTLHSPLRVIHLPDSLIFMHDEAQEMEYQHQNRHSTPHTDKDLLAHYKNQAIYTSPHDYSKSKLSTSTSSPSTVFYPSDEPQSSFSQNFLNLL